MPTSRGFDYYLGIPFSADMGTSPWHPSAANAGDAGVLPLVEGTADAGFKVIEQPCALENLTSRYVNAATRFMGEQAAVGKNFVLYLPFSHVHNPQFCSSQWCGTSTIVGEGPAIPAGHGGTGSAVQEHDAAVGAIMASLRANATLDRSTLTFYTSDNGAPSNHAVGDKTPVAAPPGFKGANWPLKGYKGSVGSK